VAGRHPRRVELVASKVRTAALVAGALLLGATGALAASAPDVVRFSPSASTATATETATSTDSVTASATTTAAATDTQTVTATETATATTTVTVTDTATGTATLTESAESDTKSEAEKKPAAPVACADAKNHGQYVSGVARSVEPGPGHGAAVREAAQSACGKGKPKDG
jgi:type VI secretion system secreted protein VgrG